jgi:hypothetical protein
MTGRRTPNHIEAKNANLHVRTGHDFAPGEAPGGGWEAGQ